MDKPSGHTRTGFLSFLLAAPLFTIANIAVADDTGVETISISALRREAPISEIGSSLSVITAEDIDDLGIDFVLDALTLSPGVTINQNGPFGGVASVRIRGAATGQTLVLLDGVPVNDPTSVGGGFNFANLDTSVVERVEVLRGPQSTLWGTDAIGGVISIVTKRPDQGLNADAFAEIGSFDTFRGGASASYGGTLGDARLGVTGLTSNGISKADEADGNTETDPYDNLTVNFRGGLNLPADIRLEASLFYNKAESEFDSFSFTLGRLADSEQLSDTEELTGNVSLNVPLFDDRLENLFLVGYSDIERTNFSNGVESFSSEGDRLILRYQGNFKIADGYSLLFGAERDRSEANGDDIAINGFFGILEAQPIEGLTLSGGVRLDDNSEFGSETTFRAALAYNPADWITLRGSWGEGFKAPTIFQLTFVCTFCGPQPIGPNTNLLAERSEAFDVGFDLRTPDERGSFSATYFNQDTENQIDFDFSVGYSNIAVAQSTGVEISASYAVLPWMTLSGDYTLIDAEDGNENDLIHIPKHTANLQVGIDPDGPFSGSMLVRYNGREADFGGQMLDNWTRVDLAAQYQVAENFELFTRIENLTDTQYQQIIGYGTPGLSFYLGARIGL